MKSPIQRLVLRLTLCLIGMAAAGLNGAAFAQAWPAKSIRLIVPLVAGGTTDVATRVIATHLSEALGMPVVVENRIGANGIVGVKAATKAAPDGYTFLVGSSTTMAANNFLYKNTGVEPLKDFIPVAILGTLDFMIVVPAASPYQTLADLVKDARARPSDLTYAYGSSGSMICSETFRNAAQIVLRKIPYQSSPQAMVDLAAGRVDMICDALGTSFPLVKAGKLRYLAVTGAMREEKIPDVPTLQESQVPAMHQTWAGFFAPAQTPVAIVNRMSAEILKALSRPDVQEKVREQGFMPLQMGSAEFLALHQREFARAGNMVKQAGIQPE